MAGNAECGPTVKQMLVSWGSSIVALSFDVTGHSDASMGYQYHTYRVIASGSVTRLSFESLVGGYCGPVLDDVSVIEVGAPRGVSKAVETMLPAQTALLTGPFLPFSWKPYPKAALYTLQLWLADPMQDQTLPAHAATILTRRITGTSYRLNVAALPSGIYHWRMVASDSAGSLISSWTRESTVTIVTGTSMSPAPSSVHTAQLATVLPGPNTLLVGSKLPFIWQAYRGASAYYLQIWLVHSATPAGLAPVTKTAFSARLTGTSYSLPVTSFARGVYHWRMAAADNAGAMVSAWTPEQTLTIPAL